MAERTADRINGWKGTSRSRTAGADRATTVDRADGVYAGLRRAIIEQSLMPGAKLPEGLISESFGVSRTLVRSALTRLVGEGLVEQIKNRGSFVASPSLAEAQQVFDVRRQLERLVVERLAGALAADQLKRLKAHVAAERQLHGRNGPETVRLAGEFHVLLAELTGNALLARYVSEVVSRSSLILALYSRPHSAECGANEHADIIDALAAGDAARARRVMDHHLGAVQDRALLPKSGTPAPSLKDVLTRYAGAKEKPTSKSPANGAPC
ncbi:MAG TPA: GntR family transcriptional regulator [Microvirga sp.]|nr:GntR family transcriptional regulator [Microvirga sp.]